MLYDFHAWQNDKRPGAVHATYMVYGVRKAAQANGHSQQDGDVEMTSSPPEIDEAMEEVPVTTLSLVPEESLKEVLAQYESVTSIHIFSLGPHPMKDLQMLADISKPTLDLPAEDNSVGLPRILGSIRNPYVRRRERRGTGPRPVAPAFKPSEAKPPASKHVPAAEPAPAAKVKGDAKAEQKPASKESTPVPSGPKKPAPAPKRGGPGGIMQSFAKAASIPKKEKKPAAEDTSMQLSDDGEDDSAPAPELKKESEAAGRSRKDRQAELRRMMEEDSEDEEPEKEDTPMEEPEEEAPAPEPEKEEPEPAEVISSMGDGRRRGKRRVMKKKTVMDDQGYLDPVTVQEQGWESFSEDEPAPPPKKKIEVTSQPAKPKKPAPKGQGNIMSFFSKK
ncbi:hypothetical protein VSDG_00282 [Cytospora chrysosperma]|uniref:DNA polymerase delta subunit 3 n=1 Tax=Cytospora chrysosperma TaxID=252740 RepID=A0A423WQU8_CYTCH|nr:hypothetical protein VSDG_00282 [Valsa sordida]